MSNLYEILTNTGNMAKEKGSTFGQHLTNKNNKPEIEPIQLDYSGNIDPQASLNLENQTKPRTLFEHLAGRTLTKDIQNTDPQTGETELTTIKNFRPGFFNNVNAGFKENFTTPISTNNFGQNTLADGRKKGFAYRAGEALGSLARFGESPLGRSLLVGGAIGALGGNPAEMLAYGATTGMLNQGNRMNDQLYRNQLKNDYGYSDEDLANIKGYVNKDTFNNIINSNYKSNMNNYRNKKLTQDSYVKLVQNLESLHKAGQISDDTFLMSLQDLNNRFEGANTYDISDVSSSNDTRKTDSQISMNKTKEEVMKNPPPKVTKSYKYGHITVDSNYNNSGSNSKNTNVPSPLKNNGFVTIKAPNGSIKKIPANQVQAAIAAGGVRI